MTLLATAIFALEKQASFIQTSRSFSCFHPSMSIFTVAVTTTMSKNIIEHYTGVGLPGKHTTRVASLS